MAKKQRNPVLSCTAGLILTVLAILLFGCGRAPVARQNLRVMDLTAISFCMENDLPICVFNLKKENNIIKAISGEVVGTTVS